MVRAVISDGQRKALIHVGQRNSRLPHALAPIRSCHLDQQPRYDFAVEVDWGKSKTKSLLAVREKQDPVPFTQASLLLS